MPTVYAFTTTRQTSYTELRVVTLLLPCLSAGARVLALPTSEAILAEYPNEQVAHQRNIQEFLRESFFLSLLGRNLAGSSIFTRLR